MAKSPKARQASATRKAKKPTAPAQARKASRKAGEVLLATTGLTKSFGDFTANNDIDFAVKRGEIHAVLGENGAGKSTFVKMLYGLLQPDSGHIAWQGKPTRIKNPSAAREMGIAMVFQHFSLFEALTVAENIRLAMPHGTYGGKAALAEAIEAKSAAYGIPLDSDAVIADLSVGERQRVEVMRCLLQNPSLLVMDEPTSVLTPQETEQLFGVLKQLAHEGCSIIIISHKLEEIIDLADRATILRDGKKVAVVPTHGKSAHHMGEMMVGEKIDAIKKRDAPSSLDTARAMSRIKAKAAGLIEVENLDRAPEGHFDVPLAGINISVAAGEILGIAGIAGNGQAELMDALTGEWRGKKNSVIFCDGEDISHMGPAARRRLGIGFVPEERNTHAAVGSMSLAENTLLTGHGTRDMVSAAGLIKRGNAREAAARIAEAYDVRLPHPNPRAAALSGGNLQKFILGREMIKNPKVLIASQPTWGVDIGATQFIRNAISELAAKGSAVILISNDLEDIFAIAHEISVIHDGILTPPEPASRMTASKIGMLMGGITEARRMTQEHRRAQIYADS